MYVDKSCSEPKKTVSLQVSDTTDQSPHGLLEGSVVCIWLLAVTSILFYLLYQLLRGNAKSVRKTHPSLKYIYVTDNNNYK